MKNGEKESGLPVPPCRSRFCRYPLAQLPEIEAHASLNQYGPELAKHWSTELRTRVIQVKQDEAEQGPTVYWPAFEESRVTLYSTRSWSIPFS